jgi:protein-S-isoprenylcysteine O-methyltransferase Ste14
MEKTLRHIPGLVIGFTVFIALIPFGLYELSDMEHRLFNYMLIQSDNIRKTASIPFFIVGCVFMIWSNQFLLLVGKGGPADVFNVSISPRTKNLVVTGPYRYSRNPMVFGALSLYTSIAVFHNSVLSLLSILLFFILARVYLKHTEEKRLLHDFGEEYLRYKSKVSMIIPTKFREKDSQ